MTEHDFDQLHNLELISAITQKTSITESNCYSDLSFFMGTIDSNVLLNGSFFLTNENISFTRGQWDVFDKNVYKPLEMLLGFVPTSKSKSDIVNQYNSEVGIFHSEENKKIKSSIDQAEQLVAGNIVNLRSVYSEINSYINKRISKELGMDNIKYLTICLSAIKTFFENEFDPDAFFLIKKQISIADDSKKNDPIFKKIIESYKHCNAIYLQQLELVNLKSEYKEEPRIIIKFSSDKINDWLLNKCLNYKSDIHNINNDSKKTDIASFLKDTQKTLNVLDILINKLDDSSKYFIVKLHVVKQHDGLPISPFKIFDSRNDIAVYGGAGAGKTTTLQMYVRKVVNEKSSKIIYLSLNRYINKIDLNIDSKNKDYDVLLNLILISKSVSVAYENKNTLEKYLLSESSLKIVFDGLDEAFVKYPGILSAINKFKEKFPSVQILISSRDCVSYLSKINFLGITLLPFSDAQLHNFIRSWFSKKNDNIASEIIENIKQKKLSEIVRTPLLATLLCDLAEKGVDIPSSEGEIFHKRLELLCGSYDTYKDVKRTELSQTILVKACIKIAFALHSNNLRSATKDDLTNFLIKDTSFKYNDLTSIKSVQELIDPCNLLFKDPISGTYSFGHLRYQEHLAALELIQNRAIDITQYLKNDWWRGSLCLYAQTCEFSSLLEEFTLKFTNIKPALITLREMVKYRPRHEQKSLNQLIDNYERTDDSYYDDHDDWTDSWRPSY